MQYTNELRDWVRQTYPEINISDWFFNDGSVTSFSIQDPRRL
jgi:hypothetical protein